MYNLIEYSDNYSKLSRRLWQYYRDGPTSDANSAIVDFPAADNNSALFNSQQKMSSKTGTENTKDIEIIMSLKYLNNSGRTLETP